jgi:hypothetical protein
MFKYILMPIHFVPIHYVCVATERKLYLPYLQSLLPELVILGLNTRWEGFVTKYKLLRAYLSTPEIKEDDLICFIDAYDVLPTKQITNFAANAHTFLTKHPAVKMIVGYDKVDNIFHEYLCQVIFGMVGDMRLNSGQFVGTVKNIREIVNYILDTTTHFQTDQIELTKYTNQFKDQIHIDEEQAFFYVKSRPLQQVKLPPTSTSAFIHANGNGCLEAFLTEEYGIHLHFSERWRLLCVNIEGVLRKLVLYDLIFIKKNIILFWDIFYRYIFYRYIYKWYALLAVRFPSSSLSA